MSGEPLREATSNERSHALSLAGVSAAHFVWVSDANDCSRTFIVCPDVALAGVAVGVDPAGREVWRKPAFYSELLRAGEGYEMRYGSLRPTVRTSWDGTWIASLKLPDGSSRRSDTPIFDERLAKQRAREFADEYATNSGDVISEGGATWARVLF